MNREAGGAEVSMEPIATLTDRIDEALGPLVGPGEPVGLIDFPSYPNVGDSAIWLGELAWLARNGSEVRYVASHRDYTPAAARRRVGKSTVLLSGGGNLGDAYPWHQRLRERVISDFPRNRIVQLPQSSTFTTEAALGRARTVFASHRDLTVMAREERTRRVVEHHLGARALLCPDMAFCLGALKRPAAPTHAVLALLRTDQHSAVAGDGLPDEVPVVDWVSGHGPGAGSGLLRAIKPVEVASGHLGALAAALTPGLARAYRRYAEVRLEAGVRTLCDGAVLITDRLHAGILCILLGIPHVLLDDRTGKLSGFHSAWLDGLEVSRIAETPERAVAMVRELVKASASAGGSAPRAGQLSIRRARPEDRDAILAVMKPANMHRLDSPEMPSFELERFFVAELDGRVVGAAGWELLGEELAKTTLLAVLPAAGGRGIGSALQRARMEAMRACGASRVRTNADRPETIAWYKRHFGYREVATVVKQDEFGDPEIDRWVTLEADLDEPASGNGEPADVRG